jgi:hypothetical protein
MRYFAIIAILSSTYVFCQAPSTTRGACSPVVSGNNNQFTFYCQGITPEEGKQLLTILNRIAMDQLDPRAVMKSLDEIKAMAARGASPENIAKGIELASAEQRTPKEIARSTYASLTTFLDSRRQIQRTRLLQLQEIDFEKQTVNSYYGSHAPAISSALDQLRAKNIDVRDLAAISQNINSIADIQKLADGFKQLADTLPSQ